MKAKKLIKEEKSGFKELTNAQVEKLTFAEQIKYSKELGEWKKKNKQSSPSKQPPMSSMDSMRVQLMERMAAMPDPPGGSRSDDSDE